MSNIALIPTGALWNRAQSRTQASDRRITLTSHVADVSDRCAFVEVLKLALKTQQQSLECLF